MRKLIQGVLALLVLVTAWSFGGPAQVSQAAIAKCSYVQNQNAGGINWTRLNIARVCVPDAYTNGAVSGVSSLTLNRVTVRYDEANSAALQVQKTTVHELTHVVEWRTTPAMRSRLYRFLGVQMNGDYFAVPTVPGSDLQAWLKSDRERLAESTVACLYGSNTFSGMTLVPQSNCPAFLATLRMAIAATPLT